MRLCNERRNIRRDAALRLHAQMAEKFNVALGAAHRGKRQVADGQLQLRSQRQKILQDLLMDGRVADDALLADLLPAGLELRLDEAEDLPRRLQQCTDGGQDDPQGNEGTSTTDRSSGSPSCSGVT